MKSIFKMVISIILIMLILCSYFNTYSFAVKKEYIVKNGGDCGDLIMRNGIKIQVTYTYIEYNGMECPVYCLDKDKDRGWESR